MGNGVDPARIHTLEDLKAAFDVLRRGEGRRIGKDRLSVQDLTRRMSRRPGDEVPRSTLANYVAGRTLPPPGAYEAILRALDVPVTELSAWADAWDRLRDSGAAPGAPGSADEPGRDELSTGDGAEPASADSRVRVRKWRTWWTAAAGTVVVVGSGTMVILLASHQPPPSGGVVASTTPPPGECAYSPVAAPIRVRPRPSFGTGTQFQTINKVDQVVIGACAPQHAESGTSCSAPTAPIDTWIPVRFPYAGWVFSACLQRIAPPSAAPDALTR